jgi:hypothetical protein
LNVQQFLFAQDWQQGTLSNGSLDTVTYINQYGHPAIVPGTNPSATMAVSGRQVKTGGTLSSGGVTMTSVSADASWSNVDHLIVTSTAGGVVSFSTTGQSCTFWLAGILVSGEDSGSVALAQDSSGTTHGALAGIQSGTTFLGAIRNGAQCDIAVNGTFVGTVDLYGNAQAVVLTGLSGTSVVTITHNGGYNSALFSPWTGLTAISGTVLIGDVGLSALPRTSSQPTFIAAQWRVVANVGGASTWKIQKNTGTVSSPVWTDQVTGLAYGATDSTHVNGMSITVPSAAYATNETVQFTTDVTMVALGAIQIENGSGSGAGTYTSPVLDSGDLGSQWFLAEWAQGLPVGSFTLKTSDDGVTWHTTVLTPNTAPSPINGQTMGFVGLSSAPGGRYAQFVITWTPTLGVPWVRDLNIYYWNPAADPHLLGKMGIGLGSPLVAGPNLSGLVGILGTTVAATRQQAVQMTTSYAVGGATDQYLAGHGKDLGLIQSPGMPPQAFATQVNAALKSRSASSTLPDGGLLAGGGGIGFIAQQAAQFVQGSIGSVAAGTNLSVTSSSGLLTATCNGVIVTQSATTFQYSVSVPPATFDPVSHQTQYPGLPGLALGTATNPAQGTARYLISQFITGLNPVGSVINPNNTSTLISFR